MPRAPLRPCAESGCPTLVRKTRCEKHTKARHRQDARTRGSSTERGYDRHWRKLRARKLRADPLCETCKAEGRTTAATEVDHVVPIAQGGARLDWSNLSSICRSCHAKKTARERGER